MGFGYSFAQEDFRDLCSPVCGFWVYGEREREREVIEYIEKL